jgi:hypothetical protein
MDLRMGDCVVLEMERELCVDDVGGTPLAAVLGASSTAPQVCLIGLRSPRNLDYSRYPAPKSNTVSHSQCFPVAVSFSLCISLSLYQRGWAMLCDVDRQP